MNYCTLSIDLKNILQFFNVYLFKKNKNYADYLIYHQKLK